MSFQGRKHTAATREKMRAASMGSKGPQGYKQSEEHKAKISAALMGNKNNLGKIGVLSGKWKGGSESWWGRMCRKNMKNSGLLKECSECKTKDTIQVHHINRDRENNSLSNLFYICLSCHKKLHHKEDRIIKSFIKN